MILLCDESFTGVPRVRWTLPSYEWSELVALIDQLEKRGIIVIRNENVSYKYKKNLNNSDFIPIEFDGFRKSGGLNSFALTPRQWIEKTCASESCQKVIQRSKSSARSNLRIRFGNAQWFDSLKIQENRSMKCGEKI